MGTSLLAHIHFATTITLRAILGGIVLSLFFVLFARIFQKNRLLFMSSFIGICMIVVICSMIIISLFFDIAVIGGSETIHG